MKNVPEDQLELLSPIRIRSHDSNSELPKLQNQEYLETLRELILDPPKENIAGKYRVLTLDGGGVKGTAILSSLAVIEKITDKPIAKLFDCIAGTSIGGVIAALLTLPSETDPDKPRYSAAELINMLGQVLSDVFPTDCSSTLRKFANLFCCCLNVSKYSPDGIETLFDQYFNQETLSSTIIPIMITAVGPSNTVKIFSSYDPETKNYNLPDILRATSAAPTYFPPARINGLDYIDGGVLANNPSNIAVRTIKTFTEIPDKNISLFYINLDKARESFIIPPNNLLSFYDKASLERFVDGAEKEATANVKNRIGAENFYEFKIHIETQYAVMDNVARDNIRQLKEIGHSACYEKNNQVTLSNFFPGYTWSEEIESEEVESSLLLGNVELIDN